VQFSVQRELDEGLFLRGDDLISRAGSSERVLVTRDEMRLRGMKTLLWICHSGIAVSTHFT